MDLHPGPEKRRMPAVPVAEFDPIRRALHENEDWYQDLVEHSQDLLCIHDLEGRLLSVNPAPARVLGYSVEELLQIPMREIVAPEFRIGFDAYLSQVTNTGESHGLLIVLTRSGERRVWEYHNTLRTEGVASPIVRGIAHDVTEQKRTEKLLRQAGETLLQKVREGERTIRELKLFRTLVDHCNDAMEVVDPETLRFLDVNEEACSALGYSREELLLLRVFDIDPVVTEASAAKLIEELGKSGSVVLERVHRRKDGSTFPVEVSLRRVQLERKYIVAIARDLTERKQAEDRLREYERVVEGLEEMIVVVDRDYRYVIANRAFLNHRGMVKEQVLGRRVDEVVYDEAFQSVVKPKLDECFQGKAVEYEMKYTYPKLGERDLLISYFPIEGPTGADRIACILRDITERKRAEEELRDAKEFSENLIQTANVIILSLDMGGNVTLFNQAAEEITGYTFAELKGKNWSILVSRDRFPHVWGEFDRLVAGTAGQTLENPILTKTGEERYIAWRNNPVKVNGRVVATISFGNDITQRRRAEEALRRSEENYRLFISQSSEGIFREDLDAPVPIDLPEDELIHHILYDHCMVECNDALAAMYGLKSGEELRGKRLTEMLVAEDPHNIELTREFIRSGFRVIDREYHEVDIHGNPKVFLNSMIGTVENGMLVRTWGIQRDITERVKLEESRHTAEEALRQNVAQLQDVTAELRAAQEKLSEEKLYLEQAIDTELGFGEIVGRSSALKAVMEKVAKVAPSDATVLLLGETGTGKELVARAVHRLSKRQDNSFIKLNCAAIPSGLLESELFGHEKGAFTGAVARKLGRLELADKGTLFLDEIGEIPLDLQPKLLRVLQDQEFERLGGTQTLKVNFRLLTATNRDLLQSVKAHEFRSDLYYRLNVFPILIPPLRERREDIRPLVEHFVRKFASQMKKSITSIPSKTMEMLVRWEWPGNIRELENFVERSVILTPGSVLQAPLAELQSAVDDGDGGKDLTLRGKERERLLRALRDCHGRIGGPDGAAARLGLKRTTLQSKLDHLGLKPGGYRS
jgi:formate hydrogenlyase transcriptional activator